MLVAESAEERLAAALALVPLGHYDEVRPVLLAAAHENAALLAKAGDVFPWLQGEACEELFWELASTVRNDDELLELASDLSLQADVRLADVYFKLMEREGVSREMMQLAEYALQRAYLGDGFLEPGELSTPKRERIVADLEPRTHSGPVAKRILAIVLLRTRSCRQGGRGPGN